MQNLYDILVGSEASERSRVCIETPAGQSYSYGEIGPQFRAIGEPACLVRNRDW